MVMRMFVLGLICMTFTSPARRVQFKHQDQQHSQEAEVDANFEKTNPPDVLAQLLLATNAVIAGLPSATAHAPRPRGLFAGTSPSRRSRVIVCGEWWEYLNPEWSTYKVDEISDAAEGLKAIVVQIPDATKEAYKTPGQFVLCRSPGSEKAAAFAIASSPSVENPFEFLVKETPASDWGPGTGWLTDSPAGTDIEMSQPLGGGFKKALDKLDGAGRAVLLASGSGIAPIRSLIESGILSGKEAEVYYGAQTPAKMAYTGSFESWQNGGVAVTEVISRPEGTGWGGKTGYVQDAAKEAGAFSKDPDGTVVMFVGQKGMAEAVNKYCEEAGIDEGSVHSNF